MTPYRIAQHPEVTEDLSDIFELLLPRIGSLAANAKVQMILDDIDALAPMPHIGTLRNEIALGLRAIPTGANAVVAFAVFEDTREVMIYAGTGGGAIGWGAAAGGWAEGASDLPAARIFLER